MTYTKLVNGEIVPMTPEEIASRQAEEATWQSGMVARENDYIRETRRTAYIYESDPVFFQWQRGDATQQQWLDKIDEIKLRYPYVV